MIGKIMGSEASKRMINNVIEDVQKRRPAARCIDYTIELTEGKKESKLYTNEYAGELRNYSRIVIGKIIADIGNKSGKIAIQKKPIFISCKKSSKKVEEFLEKIQPQNLFKAKNIETRGGRIGTIDSNDSFEFIKFKRETFDDHEIVRSASAGSDHRHSSPSDLL